MSDNKSYAICLDYGKTPSPKEYIKLSADDLRAQLNRFYQKATSSKQKGDCDKILYYIEKLEHDMKNGMHSLACANQARLIWGMLDVLQSKYDNAIDLRMVQWRLD